MPPILLKRLLQVPEETMSRYDVSTVKAIMSGGAACPTSVKKGITAKFGPVLHELYGASELGGVTIMDPEHMLVKPFSCGKPCSGMDVLLLDDNKQKITTPGVPGEIFAKGQTIDGYHKLDPADGGSRQGTSCKLAKRLGIPLEWVKFPFVPACMAAAGPTEWLKFFKTFA